MKRKLFILFVVSIGLTWLQGCGEDDYPVPPASTVPKFSYAIDNDEFAPATVTFTDESIIPERAGEVSYLWNFGDGTSSAVTDPEHRYEMPGVYKVNLVIVTSESLEINESTQTIVIKDPNASGTPVYFTNGSTVFTALINEQEPVVTSIGITTLQDSYGMAIDTVNDKLYIADFDGQKILVADLDGKNLKDFRTNIGEPDAVAIDYTNNQLYWDTSNGIRRANMDDPALGQYEDFVTGQPNDPEGMSIDPVNGRLYWNNYDGGVWRKNLNGTGETEIVPGGQGGGSIIVIGNKIYFDEYIASGDIYLKSANLDGTGVATIATGISRLVYGIAYDQYEDKIYWVDRNKSTIMRANLDGSAAEPWYTGTSARGLVIGKNK
ncbi:MAG TPA: PKD domain-containing protein [Ohtaekwangia sp.]|nr:PKD domain-containing protein [Ohtaekwangia sp.]